ncbi:MAG: TSUP family transporter [Candidatus Cloacimonetes bacterium]|nr:TSUP family transporter [Candidatus Cloacimonadota bacterium]
MTYIVLFLTGLAAGFVNTLAGGGSVLVLPILITLGGIPATVANATNRVAILMQSGSGVYHFQRAGKIDLRGKTWPLIAVVIGSAIGTLFAVRVSDRLMEILLAIILLLVITMILVPRRRRQNRRVHPVVEVVVFFGIGLYGGFVQVGVGLIILAVLNLIENYDLVRANAFKVTIVFCYTALSVLIFTISGKIVWRYGLILAAGNIIGAWLGVHSAIKSGERIVKLALVVAAALASLKLLGAIDWLLALLMQA